MRSMFTRLLTAFLAVILVCVSILFSLLYFHLRDSRVDSRIDTLKTHAREVAYLAGKMQNDILFPSHRSTNEEYLYWKINQIYDQYNAYTVIVERSGRTHTYYSESTLQDESLSQLPTGEEMALYLQRAAQGEEITVKTGSASEPLFTVIVPWTKLSPLTGSQTVMGLVMIQTAAQTIQSVYEGLALPLLLAACSLFLIASLGAFILTKQITHPLTVMAESAKEMSKGNFHVHAPVEGSSELRALSQSFNSMAEQLDSLEISRRDFVANVSHELRSPITSIQGFAEGMLDGTIPPEEHGRYLKIVADETHRLSKLIHGLLRLSRAENENTPLNISNFDLHEMIRRVLISRFNQVEEKNIDVQAPFEEAPCYVKADSDQIEQVLINLVDNALKFTPTNGHLTLSTRVEQKTVYFRIKDDGEGILPQDAAHIFDRFYKADKAHTAGQGTGLGLAISQKIMEKHHQTIRLVSGEGGAEFEITLEKGKPAEEHHGHESTGTREN